jgi:hypothetical protein
LIRGSGQSVGNACLLQDRGWWALNLRVKSLIAE